MALRILRFDRSAFTEGVRLRWHVALASTFLTLGFGTFFLLLGNALGLSIANMVNPTVSSAVRLGSWAYLLATLGGSYFLGAYLSTRTTEVVSPSSGLYHGLVSWGFTTTLVMIAGGFASFSVQAMIAGLAPGSVNWFAVSIIGFGGLAGALGGRQGKRAQEKRSREKAAELERRQAS